MPRKQRKYHYFYKTTCIITNRYYYGMHSTDNLEDGYIGSGKRLRYSINKYGRENHVCEKLEFFETRELLKQKEAEIVNENLLKDSLCMNLQPGGGGGFINKDHQKECRKGSAKWLYDKWNNDTTYKINMCKKLSDNRKKAHDAKHIIPPNWLGRKHREETKQKLKDIFKEHKHQQGNNNSQYGTCWITNNKENKKIKKTDVIPNGWKLGRKLN